MSLLFKSRIILTVFLVLVTAFLGFLYSARAVSAGTTKLGGMNLGGYCSFLGQGGAVLTNNTWSCESGSAINMNAACQWQYQNQQAVAIQDIAGNPYSWNCYLTDSVTPTLTPTPTAINTPTPTTKPTPTSTPVPTTTPTPTPTPSVSIFTIFADAFASGWTDKSYNATNSTTTTNVYQGTLALATLINANGGLDFQSTNGFSTNSYTTLHFALRATQTGQQYEVYADTVYGQPLRTPVSLANYGGQPTTSWKTYNIPLTALGASNILLKDVAIHDSTGTNQPTLFVDDVKLQGNVTPTATPTPTFTPTPTLRATATPTPSPTPTPTVRVRKNIYALTPTELQRLDNAINTMKSNGSYQDFVDRHMQTMMQGSPIAHQTPLFLPWHREFINEFEDQLRKIDPSVTLPYWDFQNEPAGSIPRVFSSSYFGSDGNPSQGDRVTDGPFASWNIIRRIGHDSDGTSILPNNANVTAALNTTIYDSAPYNTTSAGVDEAMEGWIGNNAPWGAHNGVHGYVGGDMLTMASPNDPIFWLLHADVDRLWWKWQLTNGINNYQPVSGGPAGDNLNDTMPFLLRSVRPSDVLDMRKLGYSYN